MLGQTLDRTILLLRLIRGLIRRSCPWILILLLMMLSAAVLVDKYTHILLFEILDMNRKELGLAMAERAMA